ncbi:MAG: hypothetical protein JRM77_07040 [Nitrososphaerota archaeon]|nr:hypothetical protein [Nitrososphaerota archaeon]
MRVIAKRLIIASVLALGLILDIEPLLAGAKAPITDSLLYALFTNPSAFFSSMWALLLGLPSSLSAPLPGLTSSPAFSLVFTLVLPLAFGLAVAFLTIGAGAAAASMLAEQEPVWVHLPHGYHQFERRKKAVEIRDSNSDIKVRPSKTISAESLKDLLAKPSEAENVR